jgi:Activator of Hsp90 ATPase homolog 1-like protein
MSSPAPSMLDNLTLTVTQEIHVRASLDATFAALLEQLGPYNEVGEGKPMPMVIEAWPGGRWYRDLGNGNGHYWGTVQAIKKPTLLEICGPLFMSHPVANNLQYRLSEVQGGTLIKFHHSGFGLLLETDRNVKDGWKYIHERVVRRAEAGLAH